MTDDLRTRIAAVLYSLRTLRARIEALEKRIERLERAVLLSGDGCNCEGGNQWGHDINCRSFR